jgi:hypothetical protein
LHNPLLSIYQCYNNLSAHSTTRQLRGQAERRNKKKQKWNCAISSQQPTTTIILSIPFHLSIRTDEEVIAFLQKRNEKSLMREICYFYAMFNIFFFTRSVFSFEFECDECKIVSFDGFGSARVCWLLWVAVGRGWFIGEMKCVITQSNISLIARSALDREAEFTKIRLCVPIWWIALHFVHKLKKSKSTCIHIYILIVAHFHSNIVFLFWFLSSFSTGYCWLVFVCSITFQLLIGFQMISEYVMWNFRRFWNVFESYVRTFFDSLFDGVVVQLNKFSWDMWPKVIQSRRAICPLPFV